MLTSLLLHLLHLIPCVKKPQICSRLKYAETHPNSNFKEDLPASSLTQPNYRVEAQRNPRITLNVHEVTCDENPDIQPESLLWRIISKKGLLAHARIFNVDMRSDAQYSSSSNDASAELRSHRQHLLEMRGVHVPPAWDRDEILAEVRRHQPKVDADSAPAMSSEDTSISPGAADTTFENWAVDHLESYLALVQEYPATKSFLKAEDDIQLHEILLEHEPNRYMFGKALHAAARDLAREFVLARQGVNDYNRENVIVGICHRGLLDGIFLPAKSTMLLYVSFAAENEAHCDGGHSRLYCTWIRPQQVSADARSDDEVDACKTKIRTFGISPETNDELETLTPDISLP
ncbi:hypothetical protein FPQ18DRAFT_422311 [Pyronema domesticum]|nr:hypothetical protein FPQ18DRAFT_422311 [Pyronema domesticum]